MKILITPRIFIALFFFCCSFPIFVLSEECCSHRIRSGECGVVFDVPSGKNKAICHGAAQTDNVVCVNGGPALQECKNKISQVPSRCEDTHDTCTKWLTNGAKKPAPGCQCWDDIVVSPNAICIQNRCEPPRKIDNQSF